MSDDIKKAEAKQTESDDKSEKKERDPVRTYSDEAFKQLIAERDEAKKKARAYEEAEKKLADEKLLSEGKAKELLEAREKELADVKLKAEALEKAEAERKQRLIGLITSESIKGIAQKLTSNEIEALVKEQEQKVKTDAGKHPTTGLLDEEVKDFRDWQAKLMAKGLAQ